MLWINGRCNIVCICNPYDRWLLAILLEWVLIRSSHSDLQNSGIKILTSFSRKEYWARKLSCVEVVFFCSSQTLETVFQGKHASWFFCISSSRIVCWSQIIPHRDQGLGAEEHCYRESSSFDFPSARGLYWLNFRLTVKRWEGMALCFVSSIEQLQRISHSLFLHALWN